jgi:hypothetical protein
MAEPRGGFLSPWPLALELTRVMPQGSWTLVGGLMVQLHALHAEMTPQRSTTDVDIVLHIETDQISWVRTSEALRSVGFVLQPPNDRKGPLHRFVRTDDLVDVLIADHVAPTALQMRASGGKLMQIPGATSALRKTVNCRITLESGEVAMLSVPDVLGALTLKGGAYQEDSRDAGRHLEDAVILLSTVEDADAIVDDVDAWTRSDPKRIRVLGRNLPDDHEAWGLLRDARQRRRAQQALKILVQGSAAESAIDA